MLCEIFSFHNAGVEGRIQPIAYRLCPDGQKLWQKIHDQVVSGLQDLEGAFVEDSDESDEEEGEGTESTLLAYCFSLL